MNRKHFIAVASLAAAGLLAAIPLRSHPCHSVAGLPDPKCTPGVVRTTDRNVICTQKTSDIRPGSGYTSKLKKEQMKQYGFKGDPSLYEEDHLIPLELGGDPIDPKNLWPEPGASPNTKDKVENWLHRKVCAGVFTPQQAQRGIASDWRQFAPLINN